jgi:hypothetical protein
VAALAELRDERLPAVLAQITVAGARAVGIQAPSDALSEPRLSDLVTELDDQAFDIHDAVDAGTRPYGDYAEAFARARAANAVLCAVRGDTNGALYEALHAFGADEFLRLLASA